MRRWPWGYLSSCNDLIYDDLDPCPYGVSLRFVYDYNMEFANAFPAQVDCLTLYVYDGDGKYVTTRTVTGPELRDEAYRMTLDLTPATTALWRMAAWRVTKARFRWWRHPISEA